MPVHAGETPAPAAVAGGNVTDAQWNQWRTELGDASREKRDAAESNILKNATALRDRIRTAWIESKDPDMRLRFGRMWSQARWQVIPGFTAADAKPLQGPFGDPEVVKAWDDATDRFGAAMVRVMIEMRQSPGLAASASSAFARLCARLAPEDVAHAIAEAVRESGLRAEYAALLAEAARPPADAIAMERMADVALRLEWHREAFDIAREGFQRFDDFSLDTAVAAARSGGFAENLPNEIRSLVGDRSNRITPRTWIFYVRLLDPLAMADRMPADLPNGLIEGWPPDGARELVVRLLACHRPDVARKLAGDSESAVTTYLQYLIRIHGSEKEEDAEAQRLLGLALDRADTMDDGGAIMLKLGEWLDQDAGCPELAWERLIRNEGPDTQSTATAALRMADRHERAGRLDEAIELYSRALKAAREPGASLILHVGKKSTDGVPIIEAKIRELRQRLQSEKK